MMFSCNIMFVRKNLLIYLFLYICLENVFSQTIVMENEMLSLSIDGKKLSLKSKLFSDLYINDISVPGIMDNCTKESINDSIWGKGTRLKLCYDNGREMTLSLYDKNPFLYVYTTLKNTTDDDVEIERLDITSMNINVGEKSSSLSTLGTGGFALPEEQKGSFLYTLLADPVSRHSVLAAWLTQKQGVGTFSPRVENGIYNVKSSLDFGNFRIKKKDERGTDTLLIGIFDDGRVGLETYGEYVALEYDIKLPPKPEVYCTWYQRNLNGSGASTEKELEKNAIFAKRELAPFGLNTFQIDDHWQSSMQENIDYKNMGEAVEKGEIGDGPLKTFAESNFNFPSGMKKMVDVLNKNGFTGGLWFMPFSGDVHNNVFPKEIFARHKLSGLPYEIERWSGTCIDATNPQGEEFLRNRFRRIYEWGFRYYKIDGLHSGAPSENRYVNRGYEGKPVFGNARLFDNNMTFVQCFRKGLGILKEEAPDVFLLGCAATQNMSSFGPSFGLVHAMRVGPDNDEAIYGKWNKVTAGADFAGNLYFLNNRVWYNDPDPYFLRSSISLEKARWMVSWQAVSGAMGTTSEQYFNLSPERLDMIKRALPTHNLKARPIDILEHEKPEIWLVGNNRTNIIGLFNWKEDAVTQIDYKFGRMDLNEQDEYELFDFWENKYLGRMKGILSQTLQPASCKVLACRPVRNYPQVISSSRHITQGLIDIVNEHWDSNAKRLCGKSKVVKGDCYELRIIVPDGYDVKTALCGKRKMTIVREKNLIRASFIPNKTELISWNIDFE